jgi:phytoene dehydrogenase-like protein
MYDTLIIGRDLSSLIAAIASVRKGRRTALIMEGDAESLYREAGYTFPFDPRPLSGLADGQILSQLLGSNSPADEIIAPNGIMNPAIQVVLSRHRIDIFQDRERLINDLIREFPENTREIKRFYRSVSKASSLVERWISENKTTGSGLIGTIFRHIARLPAAIASHSSLVIRGKGENDRFRRVVEAQLNFLSNLATEGSPFPLSAAYLLSLPMRGLFYPHGKIIALTDRLRRTFTEHGGTLKERCSVIRVAAEPEVAVDLECSGVSSTLSGRKLIVSAQWEKLALLLPARKVLPRSDRHFVSIRPAAYPFCLHMGVHEEGLPENMASYVILLSDGKGPVTGRDLVFLQTSLPGEIDRAPDGRRAVTATVYIADSPLLLSDQELKNEATRIIDSLEEFLPFLRDNIDYLCVDKSIYQSRRYQETVNRKYRTRRKPFFGMSSLSSRTRLSNVLLTGGILRAGLGFEGEIMAGIDAAFWAEKGN